MPLTKQWINWFIVSSLGSFLLEQNALVVCCGRYAKHNKEEVKSLGYLRWMV